MACPSNFLRILCLVLSALLVISSSGVVAISGHELMRWIPTRASRCQGSVGECLMENEFDMDSESNRRILATSNYISYGALQRNTVPCSQRGASYYNCRPGAQANPYSRGCSAITRCRS